MSSGFSSSQRTTDMTVCTVLCVDRWMCSLPFCQNANDVRLSRHWWLTLGEMKVSSRTSAAFLKPSSPSPSFHSGSVAMVVGRRPALYSSTSASDHFFSIGSGSGGGWPGLAVPRFQTFPSTRAFIAPGSSEATGSTLNGNGSQEILIFSIASAAVSSSTAQTASTGSP